MKIRIKGNSLRIRLSKTEVGSLSSGSVLKDATSFIYNTLYYQVMPVNNSSSMRADFEHNTITLYVPQQLLEGWADDSRVGFESEMQVSNLQHLRLLLEKDFKCLDTTVEDQSDFYENPGKNC